MRRRRRRRPRGCCDLNLWAAVSLISCGQDSYNCLSLSLSSFSFPLYLTFYHSLSLSLYLFLKIATGGNDVPGTKWKDNARERWRSVSKFMLCLYSYICCYDCSNLFLNGPNPASFCLISFFSHIARTKYSTNLTINVKSIDGVLGSQTQGSRMEGPDESTELWRHPNLF